MSSTKGVLFMQAFFTIFVNIILPIFLLIMGGVLLHKKFTLDLYTLAKINIYYFVPGITFVKLYEANFSVGLLIDVLTFFLLFMILLYGLAYGLNFILKNESGKRTAFTNSILFYNSANYGVPVNDLAFTHDPFAMTIQILILVLQNVLTFSYGIISVQSVNKNAMKALLGYFKTPIFYAILLGVIFNAFHISLPRFVMVPANYIGNALVSVSLLTLGAQVASMKLKKVNLAIVVNLLSRLLIGPLFAMALVIFLKMDGILAQALVISATMPTAVNVAIIAQEFKSEPEFTSQIVVLSTLLSSITVTFFIYLVRYIF